MLVEAFRHTIIHLSNIECALYPLLDKALLIIHASS